MTSQNQSNTMEATAKEGEGFLEKQTDSDATEPVTSDEEDEDDTTAEGKGFLEKQGRKEAVLNNAGKEDEEKSATKRSTEDEAKPSSSSSQAFFHTTPKLLAILHMGGATGQLFTVKQMHTFIGKYIEEKKLYDPVNKRIIRCKDDLLGEVFQVDQFIVSDLKNFWKLLFPSLHVATQREVLMKQLEPKEGEGSCGAELPWWYYIKREKNDSNLSQTTGKDSYDDRDTVGVRDTEYEDSEPADEEYYREEYEPVSETDSDATEPVTSDEDDTTALSTPGRSSGGPGLCNVCRDNPNDAAIIHGKTSHQFCCFRCAKRLKKRGKECPVCRQPIVLIVRNFIVN